MPLSAWLAFQLADIAAVFEAFAVMLLGLVIWRGIGAAIASARAGWRGERVRGENHR